MTPVGMPSRAHALPQVIDVRPVGVARFLITSNRGTHLLPYAIVVVARANECVGNFVKDNFAHLIFVKEFHERLRK